MSEAKDGTAKPPAKKKSRRTLFIVAGAIVLLAGGGAAYWMLWPAAKTESDASAEQAAAEEHKHAEAGGGIVSFEPFIVNLADTGGRRFLRISVRLIVEDEEAAKHVAESEVQMIRLRSAILEVLTAQTADQVVTPEGKAALKKTIAEQVAPVMAPMEVSDVLFSDLVVQY